MVCIQSGGCAEVKVCLESCLVLFRLADGFSLQCWILLAKSPSVPAVVVFLSDCHVEAILSGKRGDCINEELTDGSV